MSTREPGFAEFLLVMTEHCERGPEHPDHVVDCLQQIDEAFGRILDPAIEFEAYAAWRLCRAIWRVLEAPAGIASRWSLAPRDQRHG